MNIDSNQELRYALQKDLEVYKKAGYKNKFVSFVMQNDVGKLAKYMCLLRHEEYWLGQCNKKSSIVSKVCKAFYRSKRQKLGGRIGIFIPPGTVGYGFWILHSGNIIINERATVGNNCTFAGMNCVGVDDISGKNSHFPIIGDNVFVGVGAHIIGEAYVPNGATVAAGAVVTKPFENENVILAGVPARKIGKL